MFVLQVTSVSQANTYRSRGADGFNTDYAFTLYGQPAPTDDLLFPPTSSGITVTGSRRRDRNTISLTLPGSTTYPGASLLPTG